LQAVLGGANEDHPFRRRLRIEDRQETIKDDSVLLWKGRVVLDDLIDVEIGRALAGVAELLWILESAINDDGGLFVFIGERIVARHAAAQAAGICRRPEACDRKEEHGTGNSHEDSIHPPLAA